MDLDGQTVDEIEHAFNVANSYFTLLRQGLSLQFSGAALFEYRLSVVNFFTIAHDSYCIIVSSLYL
jgi:hypothetical protein